MMLHWPYATNSVVYPPIGSTTTESMAFHTPPTQGKDKESMRGDHSPDSTKFPGKFPDIILMIYGTPDHFNWYWTVDWHNFSESFRAIFAVKISPPLTFPWFWRKSLTFP